MSIEKKNVDFKSSSSPIQEKQYVSNTKTSVVPKGDGDGGGMYAVVSYSSFDDLGLTEDLLRGVYACGCEKPSEIQQKAIKPIMEGRDIVAQAQSGTEKIITFLIGAISRIDCTQSGSCQVLMNQKSKMRIIELKSLFRDSSLPQLASWLPGLLAFLRVLELMRNFA